MKPLFPCLALALSLLACSGDSPPLDASTDARRNTPQDSVTDAVLPTDLTVDSAADAPADVAPDAPADAPADALSDAGADAGDTVVIVMGCPSLTAPVAAAGEASRGDTYAEFMQGFFTTWCVRCHSTRRLTPTDRSGAPDGYNWDDESSVRMHISQIRAAVGVDNYMPLTDPKPSCAERRRVVRWIDLGAP